MALDPFPDRGGAAPGPFRLAVYDGAFNFQCPLVNVQSVKATQQHNASSVATITMSRTHPRRGALLESGARLVGMFEGVERPVISGVIDEPSDDRSAFTVQVVGDWRVITDTLAVPVPTNPALDAQTTVQDVQVGLAETVAKHYIGANAARLGLPLTVLADGGRGYEIRVALRMQPISDSDADQPRLFPAVDLAGIGLQIWQQDGGLVLDCYEPRQIGQPMTERSGLLVKGTWSRKNPTVTRIVAGDSGEGDARQFLRFIDAAREAEWGLVREVFMDATETEDIDLITAKAATILAAGDARYTVNATFRENKRFRYGTSVLLGDRLTAQVGEHTAVTDLLRSVTLSWGTAGRKVEMQIGVTDDYDQRLNSALAGVQANVREMRSRR